MICVYPGEAFILLVLSFEKIFSIFAPAVNKAAVLLRIAQMAKLVDALVSGTSVSNDVQVRVLFWALTKD